MKNKGIWLVIISIIIAGIVITMSTNLFVKKQKVIESTAAAPMTVLEDAQPEASVEGELAPQAQMAAGTAQIDVQAETVMETLAQAETVRSPLEVEETLAEPLSEPAKHNGTMGAKTATVVISIDYHARLDELGVQIQKIREEGTESTTYSLKTAADNELKLWDSELNSIYNDLLNHMNEDDDLKLIEEEREWMKARDAAAVEAAKKSSGGTLEGLEYIASLAESTKQRAYDLADMYVEVTK